jgi:lipopolysaccharide export system protein LptA
VLRIRFFRLLLPALLVLLGVIVAYNLKAPGSAHTAPARAGDTPAAEILVFKEWAGDQPSVSGNVALVQDAADGSLHLEGIQNLEILRRDGGILVVSATRGDRNGPEGQRLWHFDEEVFFEDPDEELTLTLPVLDVDEAAGEARSVGEIQFDSMDGRGTATALVYGLQGQPSHLTDPRLSDDQGGRMRADEATLWDGFDDVELIGNVVAIQPEGRLDADRMRLKRGPTGRLDHAHCTGDVTGEWGLSLAPADLAADELEVQWTPEGLVDRARLEGQARVSRGRESLAAPRIDLNRHPRGSGWEVRAGQTVYVQGLFANGPGLLSAERMEAVLDEAFQVEEVEAYERVTFEGTGSRAQGDRATYVADGASGDIHLFGNDRRKARVAQGRTRVAADEIVTDPRGSRLVASGRVEATMLPGTADEAGLQNRMFEATDAVHFVSETLRSEQAGKRLTFAGSVRGWQGERNLAAERITVDQTQNTLEARTRVSTRFPRERQSGAVAESDYVLVEADQLDYDDAAGTAVYRDEASLRFAEGWLKAGRIEIRLDAGSREISEVLAFEKVTLEITETGDAQLAGATTGQSDRLVYLPVSSTIRLFGDRTPAVIERMAEGVSTSGRVLRYRLDLGTFEVDSGDQGPASIRTSDK